MGRLVAYQPRKRQPGAERDHIALATGKPLDRKMLVLAVIYANAVIVVEGNLIIPIIGDLLE